MNIAILTMSLNIGGAETHVFELARELSANGHCVTVFSAGGVYAEKLEQLGIKHITAPFNSKSLSSLRKAYNILDEYVKNNYPCIIHSHTRISNYTANKISKKYNIPLVTTVHFNFRSGFFQRMFTRWGHRAIAVSEDLKEYTTSKYNMDRDKISVTVNGINLNTFSKAPLPQFKKELGIEPESKVILCVSRLDEIAGDHIEKVLSLAKQIYSNDNNINIVIVGTGTRFEEFSKIAEEINANTKDGFIKLVGAQTEIYKYCNISDLFIGISRSALEAMACEVPVILLGNSGYIGLFSDTTEQDCINTNFTCRGCPFPEDKVITDLIHNMLANPEEYKTNIQKGLNIVKSRYSVKRMANDALTAYQVALEDVRPFDVMICGYYGRHNLGDDILLKVITDNLKRECEVKKIALLTADANDNQQKLDRCIHRFNIAEIKKTMKLTKVFILGGGSILQDSTSSRSLYYYIYITNLAKKLGCKILLYSNGIGPINKAFHRKKAAKLLEKVDYITVRDNKSYEYIRKIGVKNPNIEITADEVFAIDTKEINENKALGGKEYICINLRSASCSDEFIKSFGKAINDITSESGLIPVLLPMHFNQDIQALQKLSKSLKSEYIIIDKPISHDETLAILNQCKFTVVERLHAIIFSCIFSKPFTAINYDPKVQALCNEVEMNDYVIDSNSSSSENIYSIIKTMINNNQKITDRLSLMADSKRTAAHKNAVIAKKIISK